MKNYPYHCSAKAYEDYYLKQAGDGITVFSGGRHQRGSGIGSVLGGIFRSAMPLLKQGGKALLRETFHTGKQVARDMLDGQSLKQAARSRAKQAGKRLFEQAIGYDTPKQKKVKKQKINRKRKTKRDIFG